MLRAIALILAILSKKLKYLKIVAVDVRAREVTRSLAGVVNASSLSLRKTCAGKDGDKCCTANDVNPAHRSIFRSASPV
jgi:hypothetical protein